MAVRSISLVLGAEDQDDEQLYACDLVSGRGRLVWGSWNL